MSDQLPYTLLGEVENKQGITTHLARWSETNALCLVYGFTDPLPAEEAGVFRGGARRVQKSTHPLFEDVLSSSADGYVSVFAAAERLSKLHIATVYSGDGALPVGIAQGLLVALVDGLAELHEAGHVCGRFTADNLVVTLDGSLRLFGAPFFALDAHRSGERTTPSTDLKALAEVVKSILPASSDAEDDGWLAIQTLLVQLEAGTYLDATDITEAVRSTGWSPTNRSGVSAWLKSSFSTRWDRWQNLDGDEDPVGSLSALFQEVPVISRQPVSSRGPDVEFVPKVTKVAVSAARLGGLLEDGVAPRLGEDESLWEAERLGFQVNDVLEPLALTTATGDPNSSVVLEVARVHENIVMGSSVTHVGDKYRSRDGLTAKVSEKFVTVVVPNGAKATRYRLGDAEPAQGKVVLELGERMSVDVAGSTYRLRVDRGAREAGRATGEKKPWKLYGMCAAFGLGVHVLFFLVIISLSSFGVSLVVETPPESERFAHLKAPSKLPKKKPKPKPKKVKKKKKKKKPKPKKKAEVKPPDPTEAKPVITKQLQKRLAKVRSRTRGAKTAAQALVKQLVEVDDSATSVADVKANIDAVGRSSGSAVFKVTGSLGYGGSDIKLSGSGGGVVTKGSVSGKAGRLGARKGKRAVRGKVRSVRALTKVRGQGSLSRAAVSKAIAGRMGRIRRCYERELQKTSKKMTGKVSIEWVVKTNGRVRGAKVKLNTLGNAKVASCVVKEIRKVKFPRPKGGEVTIVFPFIFSSR